ncbi:hypothetical protein [Nocardioides panacisoli]|uniref:SnoaL-like domain-containing protein n=1 Tax=Nocardioides panacisoli TaxID=627624 RepID=A0ABP7I4T4_9ACTN
MGRTGRAGDRASRRTIAVTLAVLATVALVAAAVAVHAAAGTREPAAAGPGSGPAGPAAIPPGTSVVAALASLTVLRDWDRDRAAAWRTGDTAALRALYTVGSEAGARDVAMLRRWCARGLRVRGMSMQVLDVRLRSRAPRRFVLVVTDRLADPVAVDRSGRTWPLPHDRASTRRLEFRRTAGRWRLGAVYDLTR